MGGEYSAESDTLEVCGRDRTADFIDSGYDGNFEFSGTIHPKTIIERVLKTAGLTTIKVIDSVGDIKVFKNELLSGAIGEKCFEFCEKYCRKRQVLLTCDGNGNLVLTRASKKLIKTVLLHKLNGTNNNVKSARYTDDDTERFAKVIIKSQYNPSITDEAPQMDLEGKATDTLIRPTRKLLVVSESSSDIFTSAQRAAWEVNIRRARGLTYDCVVYGHSAEADGRIWEPNMLVQVYDERAAINAQMLIKSVTYNQSNEGGSTTALCCVVPDAFTLAAVMAANTAAANEVMTDFEEGAE